MGDVDIPVFRGIHGYSSFNASIQRNPGPLLECSCRSTTILSKLRLDKPVIKEAHSNKCSDIRQRRCSKIVALLDFILILVCRQFLDSKFHDVIDK